jgi:ribosomal protein S18 acetylase RimI-like enzyme
MIELYPYQNSRHRQQVVDIWKAVFGYKDARNDPESSIDRKLAVRDGLFFVAMDKDIVIGTVMAGYDGHRGWIYSLAVVPERRKEKIGSLLMERIEAELRKRGCVKINLQVLQSNKAVLAFYEKIGYKTEDRISMGKEITENVPSTHGVDPAQLPIDPRGTAILPEFRCAGMERLDLLSDLRLEFIRDIHPEYDCEHLKRIHESTKKYLRELLERNSYIGYLGTDPAGAVMCTAGLLIYNLPPLHSGEYRKIGHVLNFYTKPEYRNRGYGYLMMEYIKNDAKKAGFHRLALNATAMGYPIYRKSGFAEPKEPFMIFEFPDGQ